MHITTAGLLVGLLAAAAAGRIPAEQIRSAAAPAVVADSLNIRDVVWQIQLERRAREHAALRGPTALRRLGVIGRESAGPWER